MDAVRVNGRFIKKLYSSDGYEVAEFENMDNHKVFTAVGSMLPSCDASLSGSVVRHKKYGRQLSVESFEEILPTENKKIIDYLLYAKIKNIGPATARRIVKKYGKKTFDALEDKEKLLPIRGITEKKADEIIASYGKKKVMQKYFAFAAKYSLPASNAGILYKKFGRMEGGFELMEKRPYLCCGCTGIGFDRIDAARMKLPDFKPMEYDRIYFGVLYCIRRMESAGHVFVPVLPLLYKAMEYLCRCGGCTQYEMASGIKYVINNMVRKNRLVYSFGMIYRKSMYDAETMAAEKVASMLEIRRFRKADGLRGLVKEIEKEIGITLGEKQKEGILNALTENISIITGGPGTGKTTLLNAYIRCERALDKHVNIVLCAPTGRAARKMSENTGEAASTIHSLLGLRTDEIESDRLQDIEADILVIDEMSMTSMTLFAAVCKCLGHGTRLVLIGDKDQLPSVMPGNVFSDLVQCGEIPVTVLDVTFRQEEGSSIIWNSRALNSHVPYTPEQPRFLWDKSSVFLKAWTEKDALEKVLKIIRSFDGDLRDIQVLTPYRRNTLVGCKNLNMELQKIMNPPDTGKKELKSFGRIFREGDRVIHLKNEGNVSNGDIGTITEILVAEQMLSVKFENGFTKTYLAEEFQNLDLAYALTVHKSQGSEFPVVVMPWISVFGRMRTKKLLYTAMTRAQKKLIIAGEERSIRFAADNEGEPRNSFLGFRICRLRWKQKKAGQTSLKDVS